MNKIGYWLCGIMCWWTLPVCAQSTTGTQSSLERLIETFGSGNRQAMVNLIAYPLRRTYPLAAVSDREDMLQRMDVVFGDSLLQAIGQTTAGDWSQVGWRGTMLGNGMIWLDDDETEIVTVNYQSPQEALLLRQAIAADKRSLEPALRQYKRPVCQIRTAQYTLRIDELEDGTYRYTSWKGSRTIGMPELELAKGTMEIEGSGGNHSFMFRNGDYVYTLFIHVLGEVGGADVTLRVQRGSEILLEEEGQRIPGWYR